MINLATDEDDVPPANLYSQELAKTTIRVKVFFKLSSKLQTIDALLNPNKDGLLKAHL